MEFRKGCYPSVVLSEPEGRDGKPRNLEKGIFDSAFIVPKLLTLRQLNIEGVDISVAVKQRHNERAIRR